MCTHCKLLKGKILLCYCNLQQENSNSFKLIVEGENSNKKIPTIAMCTHCKLIEGENSLMHTKTHIIFS